MFFKKTKSEEIFLPLHFGPTADCRGALLIEVILAMLILSIGLTAILQAMGQGVRAASFFEDYSRAALLADAKMAEILIEGPGQNAGSSAGRFAAWGEKYQYEISSEEIAGGGQAATGLRSVRVKVFWAAGVNQKDVTLVTYLYNPVNP